MASQGQWTTGLFDYWEEPSQCKFQWCCPCYVFGDIAEMVDGGTTPRDGACWVYCCLNGSMAWLMGSMYRTKLRRLFSLPEEPFSDQFVHCCCAPCALTQEYKELKHRAIDPSLGWQGNVEKWESEGVKPPIVPTMSRYKY
ncbi:protein PLANT CADMIUM RESISTANCE 9-like [Prosopis cineraria]|uniref:protein PLANT CADMIUM RESISTANCE 9-like n=1 Tax=Prosopis cineraria TaxID=364024 RepID=UPI0024101D74|nr:protein PLANT CADMIUM RESISTANCE 9-like [Prosopis cineraria]